MPWKEVRKQTKRGRDRFRMADLFADQRCSRAVLRFLETTGVGKAVPKGRPTEDDSGASVVDYVSEPEEVAEAQQVRQLAQMETELGMLPWVCPGRVYMYGLCLGNPPGGEWTAGSERADRGEVWRGWRGGERSWSDLFCASLIGSESRIAVLRGTWMV